ncbi:MAG: FosX/FosE/FosI family fosfomycin resistance hydrolase [Rickettsiales bacterium]|nr:FosX/FosE/FosI family fosfomycin resistance hydrolase [Rickettsiales bacterium]
MIEGISHITLVVSDLEKMKKFLVNIFDAEEVYNSGTKTFSFSKEKFFLVGEQWIAIMEGEPPQKRSYEHIAFKISKADFELYEKRVYKHASEVKTPRERMEGEGDSLYFYDDSNHLFELHTGTLKERLKRYNVR